MAINESMSLSEIFATYDGAKKNLAQNVEAVKNSGQKIAAIFAPIRQGRSSTQQTLIA